MPIYSEITKDEDSVVIWHITEDVNELLRLINLSSEDAEILDAFKLDKRKNEWLASRILLQGLLKHYPEIEYSKNGKPYLRNSESCISISHTNNFAAVSLSKGPTALDIEVCAQRVEKVANRFVHPDEEKYIDVEKRLTYLTVLWSAKETLYKYFDVFGVSFKEQFLIHPFVIDKKGMFNCEFKHQNITQKLTLHYEVNNHYILVYKL